MNILSILCDAAHEYRQRKDERAYRMMLDWIREVHRLDIVAGTPTVETPAVCAWCLAENGHAQPPREGQSHGCCERHAAAMKAQRARRLAVAA